MANIKTINRLISNDFPFMELVKGSGYFYFVPNGSDEAGEKDMKKVCSELCFNPARYL